MKTVSFGEIMLRLSPSGFKRFLQADSFDAYYGGGEANVAVSLAEFGIDSFFVTKLPDNPLGCACRNELRKYGVNTSKIVFGGDRLGIYFCEKGASQRPSNVVYDRAGSSISQAKPEDFDWDDIFKDADWFHFTGITPALNDSVAEICKIACIAAKQRGIKISCDLNYRKKLWSREKAGITMSELCKYVDVLIANEEDSADVFGIRAPESDIEGGKLSREGYKAVASQLFERFGFEKVAITLRESVSASENYWSGMLCDRENQYFSQKYRITLVDRIGGGDSFGAGLIYSMLSGFDLQHTIEYAVAASCLKQTIEGDFNAVTVKEVENLIKSGGSGRVVR